METTRRLTRFAAEWLEPLVRLVYPHVCAVCHGSLVDGEDVICLTCLSRLPRTHIHTDSFNMLHQRLASPGVPVEKAGAWFHYLRGNEFSSIIHDAKYHGMAPIARKCGAMYAQETAADGFFDGVDMLLPVPMHESKLIRRGYNQAHEVAEGIGNVTGIPVGDHLTAVRAHGTQTRKNAWQRWLNARDTYCVKRPGELAGKHVMVVDDVVTTGATILACLTALHRNVPGVVTSVAALAATLRQ